MPKRNWKTIDELIARNTKAVHECWIWQRAISHKNTSKFRYGVLWENGRSYQAHRFVYERLRHSIPSGKQLHHACANTLCVNPDHLKEVTPAEHVYENMGSSANKTHCPHGHAYTPENTKWQFMPGSNGTRYWKRFCRECHRIDGRKRAPMRRVGYRHA